MIEVIDYDGGNMGSIAGSLKRLGVNYRLATQDNPPSGKLPVVFPGVGAFGATMSHLTQSGLSDRLRGLLKDGTPYLGICIGLQVLFERSEEAPGVPGLGVIGGNVVKFKTGKVPQVGWNWITSTHPGWDSGYVYFVNSYYPQVKSDADILYTANYHETYTAAVQTDSITAFQFHPEKSGSFGQVLLQQWMTQYAEN